MLLKKVLLYFSHDDKNYSLFTFENFFIFNFFLKQNYACNMKRKNEDNKNKN